MELAKGKVGPEVHRLTDAQRLDLVLVPVLAELPPIHHTNLVALFLEGARDAMRQLVVDDREQYPHSVAGLMSL